MVQFIAANVSTNGEESTFKVIVGKTERGKTVVDDLSRNSQLEVEFIEQPDDFESVEAYQEFLTKLKEEQQAKHGIEINLYPCYAEK